MIFLFLRKTFLGTTLLFFPLLAISQTCDKPEASEQVRIYYVNGMNNSRTDMNESIGKVRGLFSNSSNYSYGISINSQEANLEQGLQVFRQRVSDKVEPPDFWRWVQNPVRAHLDNLQRAWFDKFIKDAANSQYSNDAELRVMVNEYLQDLRSGKKVVLVSHSQGNFYANNAYQYILQTHPQYQKNIGIVAVGSPASKVQDGGRHTNNSLDRVINTIVRNIGGYKVLDNNITYNQPNDLRNHNFIKTYIAAASFKIRGDIVSTINRLQQPSPIKECDPNQAIARTGTAYNITPTSATLRGYLTKGTNADVWFVYGSKSSDATCRASSHDGVGSHNADGSTISTTRKNLSPNTLYYFRMCAMASNKILSSGRLLQFITKRLILECNSDYTASGGSNGLSVTFSFGNQKGWVSTRFETFEIPDAMTIYEHNSNIIVLQTPGYVSGVSNGSFYVDGGFNAVDIRVYGNSNTNTKWNVRVGCPNKSLSSKIDGFLNDLFGSDDTDAQVQFTRQTEPSDGTEDGIPIDKLTH